MSVDGRFRAKVLDMPAAASVGGHALPADPNFRKLRTEAYLPK